VYSGQWLQPASPGAEDSNGNYAPWGAGDTLGRSLPTSVFNCNGNSNQTCYAVPNSQGGTSTYTVTTATINVNTAFGQSGVTEFSGTMGVVSSIALPDGTSYTFKFDCDSTLNSACGSPHGQTAYYGLLTSMTLPTGGVVSYGYTNFSDSYSNKVRWLNSRQTVGGTWSYSPQVISTCTSTQVGCQQKVTVTAPSGDHTIYTFTLNNGAWPVQIQSYDSSSNLLQTVNNTYDFSQACPFSGCHGAAYIRLLKAQTTVSTPAGSITKQTQYQYDPNNGTQTGNITTTQEWGFYSGSAPSFPSVPDRATFTTYLSTGTNDINRPLSVSLCNNSGADSACPGGGTRVQQALYAYDNYSGCPSQLAVVNGVMNHDDTNFGGSYTMRGNPTQIQNWVSGSTYLTTQLCYDTTGQVTQETDPAGNITKYFYTDQFYSDNGSNSPPSYTPSNPTNAYVTSVILPTNWTMAAGYYYGSGRQALFTDPNGAKTYSHFMDLFDRPTENDYPIGWDKTVYTGTTQADVYSAIGDTLPSSNCQSCQDKRILLDNFGRKISEHLENYPGGASKMDTAYDTNGRVYSVSHPYQGSSGQVYESFSYDGLSRTTQNTHPDAQHTQTYYGPTVSPSGGGVGSQQGSPSTYGYGYPVLSLDEGGKQRQEWLDGFGRIIEVDEPATTAATPGQGSVSISGSEQSIGGSPATSGTGSVTVSGTEQSVQVCTQHLAGGDCGRYTTRYDHGTVSITVNGVASSVSYSQGSTSSSIATGLASAINANTSINSLVSASASGSRVTITARQTGSQTNYSLSAAATSGDTTDFPDGSFFTTASGATLTGGNNAVGATYDFGTVSVIVNGSQYPVSYGQSSTPSSLASALAQAINGSSSPPVTASANGSVVSLTSMATGAATNYSLSATSSTGDPSQFSGPSFATSPSGSTLTGGSNSGSSLATPAVTLYQYDAANNLMKVLQGLQTRTTAYDGLARPTSMTTPEAGTEYFYYTKSDNLSFCAGSANAVCRKTDARGITTTYTYDLLSRLTGRAYSNTILMPNVCTTAPNNTAANVCNYFDAGGAGAFALGRLTSIADPSGSETFTYNAGGRITQQLKVIGSTTFPILYQYNAGGQLTQITYPSGRVVNQNVDNVGLLNTIASGGTTFASIPEPSAGGYNAAQQLLSFTYGNGVTASFAYSSTRQQMTSLSYVKGSTTLFSLNYYYQNDPTSCTSGSPGNDGLIQCIVDNTGQATPGWSGRSVAYTYDALGRLSTALTTGTPQFAQWGISWAYDAYGNRTNQTVTAGSAPSNSLTFATTPVPPVNPPGGAFTNRPDGYSFDASGNMLNDGVNNLSYDAENCQTSAGTTTYTCDARAIRVQKTIQGGTTTVYVFSGGKDIAEYDNGAGVTSPSREYIYLGGRLISTIQGATTLYHHADHLSVRVTTDVNGTNVGEQGHYPYGEQWYATNSTTKFFFTSYERDLESGNDYAMARSYINRFGRFACVDPLLGQPGDPQSWNRYAYVRNNPINNIDPSGKGLIGWLVGIFRGIAAVFIGHSLNWGSPGVGTPPIFSDPMGDTQATLNSIYNPPSLSQFGIQDFTASQGVTEPADKPWDLRSFLVRLLRGDNPCSKWLNNGKGFGSAADIMSNVPINLRYPSDGKVPVVGAQDAWPENNISGTAPAIGVARYGRYYADGPSGLDVDGFSPGSTEARSTILLHELAHVVQPRDFIQNDASIPGASEKNTKTTGAHCHDTIVQAIAARY
jgi:RHS repeat-associated protein